MQDEQVPLINNNEQAILSRMERLIGHLEDLWKQHYEISFDSLKVILASLPEPYHAMGIATLADRLVNDMKLHVLDVISTFYKNAEQEGIDAEERDEVLQDVLQQVSQLMQLNKRLSVSSLDDLFVLSNTTFGLRSLSQTSAAASAQSWMYKLPTLYQGRLEQEHLVAKRVDFSITFSIETTTSSVWHPALANVTRVTEETVSPNKMEIAPDYSDSNWANSLPKSVPGHPKFVDGSQISAA
jgi:hypothetical protein